MSNTIITERGAILWIQIVASKSGGEAHIVRHFENGLTNCDCDGFNWRGHCSHLAIGKQQEAREALAQAEQRAPAPAFKDATALRATADYIAARGQAAYADLFGAEWAVR